MARKDEEDDGGDSAETSHGPQECMPCRGTGRVVSNLGGEANKVTCPWCLGEGTRQHGIDAQARWSESTGDGVQVPAAEVPAVEVGSGDAGG
jgi:DnaJ-class molecular chaperone